MLASPSGVSHFVRDGEDGLETILTYRPGSSPLGVVAFPGGTVTPGDDDATPGMVRPLTNGLPSSNSKM